MSKEEQLARDVIRHQRIIVDIYCRVSTDDQEDNTSLDAQEAEARQYCKEHSLIVGEVHKEVYSGYKYRERKKLELMRQRYREGKIQGVVIRTLDRLSRSQAHVAILLEEMEHHNTILHSVKEVIDETPMGKFARMVLAFVAEMEREKIMDRTITGRINAAKDGRVVTGTKAPYGWKWIYDEKGERDYIAIDEDQAEVLRRVAQEYADGESMNSIIKRLMAEGVPAPSGKKQWYPAGLRKLLTDSRITGKNAKIFTFQNTAAKNHIDPINLPDGTYPAIISEELYARIVQRAATNAALATRNASDPERFLLRAGFARCAHCNYAMSTRIIKGKDGKEYLLYRCSNRFSDCTEHHYVSATQLDAAVWDSLTLIADHVPLIEEAIEAAGKSHTLADDLRAADTALATWKAKIANYEGDLDDPSLRGDTRAGIRQLLNAAYEMVERLEIERATLVTHSIDVDKQRVEFEKILAWCKTAKEQREEMSYQQKRDFLTLLGATVIVEKRLHQYSPLRWNIHVRLPQIEEIIYASTHSKIGNDLSAMEIMATGQQRLR